MFYHAIAVKLPRKFNSFRHLPLGECNFPASIKRLVKQVAFQSNANHPLAESMGYIKFEGM